MNDKKHVYRNWSRKGTQSQSSRIRYDSDDFRMEIYSFDKSQEKQFLSNKESQFKFTNGVKTSAGGYTIIQSEDSTGMTLTFEYTPLKEGNYRLDFLYVNTNKIYGSPTFDITSFVNAEVYINNVKQTKTSAWRGFDTTHNRHYTYFTVTKKQLNKKLTIKYKNCTANMGFVGLSIKQYDIWKADRNNELTSELTIKNAEINITNELDVDDMTVNIMYWHGLDSEVNQSTYVFDYRDEINFYITDTQQKEQLVFGGYISTVSVDEDLTNMTLTCASRLIDLDHRYCLSEIGMNSTIENGYKTQYSLFKNYNEWNKPLKFLCDYCELPLKINFVPSKDSSTKKNPITIKYGKKNEYKSFTNVMNMDYTFNDNNVTLRNGNKSGKLQSICIFDKNKANKNIDARDFNALWIDYGLGDYESQGVAKGFELTSTNSFSDVVISSNIGKQAQKITTKTGWSAVKPIWKWVNTNIKYEKYRNFHYSASSVLIRWKANCCDQARLLMELCSARGVNKSDMHYCYAPPKSSYGHVFAKIKDSNGTWHIVDPVTSKGWGRAWDNGHTRISKETTFPNRPF